MGSFWPPAVNGLTEGDVAVKKLKDAQPRTVIPLWKANLEEPKPNQPDPSATIVENSSKTRIKLAPGKENDMQQLQWFCDACKGIPQARIPGFLHNSQPPAASATAPPDAEELELAMATTASIQSAIAETSDVDLHSGNETNASAGWNSTASTSDHSGSVAPTAFPPSKAGISEWTLIEAGSSSNSTEGT